jgi:hypothetical protein
MEPEAINPADSPKAACSNVLPLECFRVISVKSVDGLDAVVNLQWR